MKLRIFNIFIIAIITLTMCQSCEQDEEENEIKISSFNSTKSHNPGENCMNCHTSGGSGEGWFTIAGTVYDAAKNQTFPNATVSLFTGPGGTGVLKATIQVDKNGNFYTTEKIDFENGLYTSVEGNSNINYMNATTTGGQCNGCHGVSTDRIWTE